MFRKTVREFVDAEIVPHVEEWEAAGTTPLHEVFAQMGELGFLGLEYDPAFGGQGADHSYTVILGEELGRVDTLGLAMATGVQTDMATPSLARFGSDELKERYLAPACRGEMVASIAVTEADAGSDVAGLRTRAVRDGDEYVINGSKLYITNGTQADWLCLLARTSDEGGYRGMCQFVVPTDRPGFGVSRKLDKLGMRSSDTAELTFDEVRVPAGNLIGVEGRGLPAADEPVPERADDRGLQHHRRHQGRAAPHPHLPRRTAGVRRPAAGEPVPAVRAGRAGRRRPGARSPHPRLRGAVPAMGVDTSRDTTICKLLSARLLRKVADWCLQFHGGIGYMEETWTARFFRDARLWSIGGGADEIMLRTLARTDGFSVD